MHPLTAARAAAEYLAAELAPYCQAITIAGSIRRQQRLVKDIEIVAQAAIKERPRAGSLFEVETFDLLAARLDEIAAGRHHAIIRPKVHAGRTAPWGPRYKKLWITHGGTTYAVDLFIATAETWGPVLTLRTGPAEYSKLLVTSRSQGGAMPAGMKQEEGRLWRRLPSVDAESFEFEAVETPTEESYFAALRVPFVEPQDRTEERLRDWLRSHHGGSDDRAAYSPFRKDSYSHARALS
jgi:DNA polymerase/3'-5' exonuclease PolX